MLGFLARWVDFTTHGDNERRFDLGFSHWLKSMHPESVVGSHINREQRKSLLSLCHAVYDRFCGSLEKSEFTEKELRSHRIYPFISHAVYFGFDDYAESWMEEESRRGHYVSPEFYDALLKGSLMGHSKRVMDNLKTRHFDTVALGFQNSIFLKLHSPPRSLYTGIYKLLEAVDKQNLRLPPSCIPYYLGENSGLIQTSQIVLEVITALIAHYTELQESPVFLESARADRVADIILKLLDIFAKPSAKLHDRIVCTYQLPRIEDNWDKWPPLESVSRIEGLFVFSDHMHHPKRQRPH